MSGGNPSHDCKPVLQARFRAVRLPVYLISGADAGALFPLDRKLLHRRNDFTLLSLPQKPGSMMQRRGLLELQVDLHSEP